MMAKVLCVLYDDPVDGYPTRTRATTAPASTRYPGGQTAAVTRQAIDFTPGELLGSVSGELGLRRLPRGAGHTLVVTSDKEGPTRSSSGSCPMPTSSSRSRSGPHT